ncbi:type I-E CRISPR-associated protein Cse2/CasB [Dermacoccus barathri]|uniref:Type I-E CRISPR-associated protein Cse2/CasB n=1 Tax=Dermacoccus barathri TaxID=322601 RepID=A0ABN2B328_9MICO
MAEVPYVSQASRAVAAALRRLEQPYFAKEGFARQALAELRRATPGAITDSPYTWPYVFQSLSGQSPGQEWDGDASPVEKAVHAALVLWASHQQSGSVPVSVEGISLGRAAGILSGKLKRDGEPIDAGVLRRFSAVTTATSFSAQMRALSQLVSLFRANGVMLDYPRLAGDLRNLQEPARRQRVLVRWARDFHRGGAAASDITAGSETTTDAKATPTQEQE